MSVPNVLVFMLSIAFAIAAVQVYQVEKTALHQIYCAVLAAASGIIAALAAVMFAIEKVEERLAKHPIEG